MKAIAYLHIILALAFLGCRKENADDCFTASGKEVSQVRTPGVFNSLVVYDKFDVTIVKGPEHKVEVRAGRNLLSNIITRVRDGVLYIEDRNTCNFVRGYKRVLHVTVTVPHLRRAENSSVGTMRFDADFEQDSLIVRAENSGDIHVNGRYHTLMSSTHGNGDMYLEGSCRILYIYTYGLNYVHATGLSISDYAFVDTYSLGDVHINAEKLHMLEYHIARDGNIYYSGEPAIVNDYSEANAKGKAIRN